jgi:hypothetical protein
MTFLIADTFTDSLARLTGDEQKAAKTTAFDLQMDPSAPGLSFHRLDKAKDKRFWSVRVSEPLAYALRANVKRLIGNEPRVLERLEVHAMSALGFRAIAVMACDDEILPLQERIEHVGDTGDLREVYDTERQLLYVACTRARDRLSITAVEPASEFLDDLKG